MGRLKRLGGIVGGNLRQIAIVIAIVITLIFIVNILSDMKEEKRRERAELVSQYLWSSGDIVCLILTDRKVMIKDRYYNFRYHTRNEADETILHSQFELKECD